MRKDELYTNLSPQSLDSEEAVIGACLLERDAFDEATGIIKHSEYFYSPEHQHIWKSLEDLDKLGKPIDLVTVTEQLRKNGTLQEIGGAVAVIAISQSVVTSAHIVEHCRIIAEKYIARETIKISNLLNKDCFKQEKDVFNAIEGAISALSNVLVGTISSLPKSARILAKEHQERISELQKMNGGISGVPSGHKEIDSLTYGWQKSDLIILAARPAVGKTAFAVELAVKSAMNGHPSLVFELEMSSMGVVNRIISSFSENELWKYVRPRSLGQSDMHSYVKASKEFSELPIFIDDKANMTVQEMKSKAIAIKKKHGLGLIVIDFLQLIQGRREKNGNREQEISGISRDLKVMAKELEVPIIALSQLNRGVENRQVKIPTLADLRESGAIEQDADMVLMMYRPEYYGNQGDAMGETQEGLTEFHFAKFRNGESNQKVQLIFEKEYQRFRSLDDVKQEQMFDNPHAGIRDNQNNYNSKDWEL